MLRSLLFILAVFNSSCASGQQQATIPQLKFQQLGAAEGLPQSHITCVVQDLQGFMWIGTWDGLYRYDGYEFKAFHHDPLNKNSLNHSRIECLLVDRNGQLWVGTIYGLHCYNPETGIIRKYLQIAGDSSSLCDNRVNCLNEDDNGDIWVGTEAGLSVLKTVNDKFTSFHHNSMSPSTISNDGVMCLLIDKNRRMWIGTADGLNLFHPGTKTFSIYKNKEPGMSEAGIANSNADFIPCMLQDQHGNFLIGTWSYGLQLFNPENHSFKTFRAGEKNSVSVAGSAVNAICEDHKGNIWVGTYDGGLNIFDTKSGQLTPLYADVSLPGSLKGNHVMCIYADRSGMLWVGTNGGGLNVAGLSAEKFSVFKDYDEDIQTHFLLHVSEDREKNIWLSSFGGGLKCFNPETMALRSYEFRQSDPLLASCNWVQCSLEDREGNIWFGVFGGLALLHKNTGSVDYHRYPQYSNETVIVHSIEEGNGDTLWLATSSGFRFFSKTSGRFFGLDQEIEVLQQDVPFIYRDRLGKIWIAGASLWSYDPMRNSFHKYVPDFNTDSTDQMRITGICEDRKGNIWAGTISNGLLHLDHLTGKLISFTTEDGLASNAVAGVVEDDDGRIWVSTAMGISKWNGDRINSSNQFRNYDISDGIAGNDNGYNTILRSSDGTIYVGTSSGLYFFDPDNLINRSFIPPVIVTGFQLMNREISTGDSTRLLSRTIEFTREITIAYSQNVLSFSFAALNYDHAEKNQYAYQLEGFDKDWIFTNSSKRFANYTNMDAGTYVFKVKGSNNDGVWNQTPAEIKLIVLPPYWQTWWFKFLVGSTLALAIYGIYLVRNQKMHDARRIRNKIASNLHDDLGATLSSISIMSEIANQQIKEQSPQTSLLLEKIGSSSRTMIENVNDMVWAINPKNDNFENIIKRMRTFAAEILGAKDINFNFDFDKNLLQSKLKMDTRRNFYLIFKEAINNIAKYSGAANTFITILERDQHLKMTIRDDGNGFDLNSIKKGNGLNNMKQRAEEMKAKFTLQTGIGEGTMVQLECKTG